jgi:hypothetical protein
MPLFEVLRDTFNDNLVDTTKWPNNYNTGAGGLPTETGGRARVVCNTGFSAYASDNIFTLEDSHAWVRMWPPAAGGAATEAWSQLLINSSTAGTDAIFEVNAVTGLLTMAVRVGFFDAGAVSIAYNTTDHAWLRIQEAGGNLLWDTSADGLTWVNRRTTTSPVWVSDADLEVQLITHRDSGTPDFAEFDSFNVIPSTAKFEQLTDDFNAASVDTTKWPDNYNTLGSPLPDQPDGRARVPCDEGFAAYASAPIYTLADSHALVQSFPPSGTGMTEAYSQLLILSDVDGTNITYETDTATNSVRMATRVDFIDQAVNVIGYDPTAHAWLRVREAAGTVFWDTAPDGRTWTTQFSATSPAWVSEPNLQVQLLAHCSPLVTGGALSGEFAEFDNFNLPTVLPDGYTVAIDWDGDGTFDDPHEDVTDDVLQRGVVTFQYGRDQARALSPPRVGELGFILCNAERIYSPENPSSPISEDVAPAAPVKVSEVIDDVLYPLVTGRIDTFEISSSRGDRSVTITALDGLALLRGTRISTELYAAQRTGTLIGIILDTIGWTAPRDLDIGATHVPWWWANDQDAFDLMTELLRSEGPPSIAYVAPDGTLTFRDRHHRLLRSASLQPQADFLAVRNMCLTTQVITGPPELLQVSDDQGVLATLTVGAKTVAMRGPTRTFAETKRPFTDTFTRTLATGFGSSGGGGNYSVTGSASDFSVNGTVGVASLPTANASRFATIIDNMTDVDVTATVTVTTTPTGAASSVGLVFGYTDVDNNLRARLIFLTTGVVQLILEKEVADVVTILGAATQVGTGFTGGNLWHIRAQRTSTTIRCRAWKDGDPEPGTWLHSVTEPDNPVGRVGFRFLASTGSTGLPRVFHVDNLQLVSGTWPTIPTVTHNTWVRALDEPFNGQWTNDLAEQILGWTIDSSPDVLAHAMRYITGAPPVINPTLDAQVAGQANYGPLNPDGTREEGADFHDYMGLDWTYSASGETRTADPDELTSLDCSGFVRMVYGFQLGLPMVFEQDIDGINLPRRTLDIGPSGPGIIVAQAVGTPPSLANIQIGDVPHFDATSDGETSGQVDHNGIYIGTDSDGNMRFINSRKTPNGPTFGDLGGASVLNGSGTYTTRLRIIRRF